MFILARSYEKRYKIPKQKYNIPKGKTSNNNNYIYMYDDGLK